MKADLRGSEKEKRTRMARISANEEERDGNEPKAITASSG
jgi:hypothetical protein